MLSLLIFISFLFVQSKGTRLANPNIPRPSQGQIQFYIACTSTQNKSYLTKPQLDINQRRGRNH